MSFSVDQFMQVKCKLQLTSESESSDSIHNNCDQIRLCASADLDKNSTLIAMVCSNETSNNNILAYYIERRQSFAPEYNESPHSQLDKTDKAARVQPQASEARQTGRRTKPKIVIKQIYYHTYNEDIVALCLTDTGEKLILINSASTIYILPIKNILLNLHAQQLRSSQGKSMYFYDAQILTNLSSIKDPIDIVFWHSLGTPDKSYIVVACRDGHRLVFLDVEDKKELCSTSVSEPIKRIEILRDRFSHSLLITCQSCNQYRLTLELLKQDHNELSVQSASVAKPSIINLPKSMSKANRYLDSIDDETVLSERDFTPSWTSKPLPIRLNSTGNLAAGAIQRVFTPASRFGSQASLSAATTSGASERARVLLFSQAPNYIAIVDILGARQQSTKQSNVAECRLLRFYSNRQYFYRSQRPQVICKLDSLEPDEMITHLALTERFIAFATDRHRCVINSRNCCKLKNPTPQTPIKMDPLVKEVTFNNEEKILSLIRSPATYDQDNILDSFILVTTRCIYSIDARHNCRDLFINLIDSHLAIKRTLFMPRTQFRALEDDSQDVGSRDSQLFMNDHLRSRSAESNLLINDFLQHRKVYERICHDSLVFSTLFKLELSSLYEAYADRLMHRHQFELANRFFMLASFDHSRILGKYLRIGAFKETVEYVKGILSDENDFRKVLAQNERLEMAKIAVECLLAKTLIERSKALVYETKIYKTNPVRSTERLRKSTEEKKNRSSSALNGKFDILTLCEHSPKCQDAKLSTTTIVGDFHEDDETLTSNTEGDDFSSQRQEATQKQTRHRTEKRRLECEKALIDFIEHLMPSSLYEYVIDRMLDFDLLDLIGPIAHTDMQVLTLIKALIKSRDDERLLFRTGKLDALTEKLDDLQKMQLAKINTKRIEFLEFITSPRVTRALVKDISLTCDFYGYQHTLVQFRKYSFAALRHLESYRSLISAYRERDDRKKQANECVNSNEVLNILEDDNANDGVSFLEKPSMSSLFNEQQKQTVERNFLEFLTACLEESTEDSCRLWFNYINFYLNYVGDMRALESDILRMMDTSRDCRVAISLYKAIYREETAKALPTKNGIGNTGEKKLIVDRSVMNANSFLKANLIANTPLEAMKQLHNLADLFANEFLMRLLDKTLDLLPHSADLEALTIATMC